MLATVDEFEREKLGMERSELCWRPSQAGHAEKSISGVCKYYTHVSAESSVAWVAAYEET